MNIIRNKTNTQTDDYSCGYHAILGNYLLAIDGEVINNINNGLSINSDFDKLISKFRKLITRPLQQ